MAPLAEPITKARIDSHNVIKRCFQITPLENHVRIWLKTSTGLEKKNGGSSTLPNTGTVAKNCHSASATMATRSCNERSASLDITTPLSIPLPLAGRGQGWGYHKHDRPWDTPHPNPPPSQVGP